MDKAASERDALNQGFDIKYLVVMNNGSCRWHHEMAANDNVEQPSPSPMFWRCTKTMRRFRTPGNDLEDHDWFFFCHWLVRSYPNYIVPFNEQFVREVSEMGMRFRKPKLDHKRVDVLQKLLLHIYTKLKDAGQLEDLPE